jgi:hypothetical protein
MCRGFKLGDGEGPQLSFCSAARGKAGKRASPVRRLAAARSCAQPASLARQPNAGLRTCAQRQTDGSARSSLRDESRASAVFLFLGMSVYISLQARLTALTICCQARRRRGPVAVFLLGSEGQGGQAGFTGAAVGSRTIVCTTRLTSAAAQRGLAHLRTATDRRQRSL